MKRTDRQDDRPTDRDRRAPLGSRERAVYARQMSLPGWGEAAQVRLRGSSVLIARAGGLGGTVAMYLAAAGVGRMTVMHGGSLIEPDLNRQMLMAADGVGLPRAGMIRESLLRLRPDLDLTVVAENPDAGNLDARVAGADVVCDCAPTFEERYAINRAAVRQGRPMVEAAMCGWEGYVTVVVPGRTACLRCLYPAPPADWQWEGFPVLGAVSGTVACLAAAEAVKVLTGVGRPLAGRLLTVDVDSQEHRRHRIRRDPACPDCGGM